MDNMELDSFDPYGEDAGAELVESATVFCPYCGEAVEIAVDQGGGLVQEYVEDCEVCCRPWTVRTVIDGAGHVQVSVMTLDES